MKQFKIDITFKLNIKTNRIIFHEKLSKKNSAVITKSILNKNGNDFLSLRIVLEVLNNRMNY